MVPGMAHQACMAATTGSVSSSQAEVVDEETDLVLAMMGGNDVNFAAIVFSCFGARVFELDDIGGLLSPLLCKSYIDRAAAAAGPDGALDNAIEDALLNLQDDGNDDQGDEDLRDDARVVLLSYPYLDVPEDFFEWYPVGQEIRALGDLGDQAQASAVAAANAAGMNVLFLDTIKDKFAGHEPDGSLLTNPNRWLLEWSDVFPWWDWWWEPYHPNPAGQQAYAEALSEADLLDEPEPLARGSLDVTFVVDASSSMVADIAAMQDAAADVIGQLESSTDRFRIGLVSYRDAPAWTGVVGDYASSLDQGLQVGGSDFVDAVDGLSAAGGGDAPDSVFSGLAAAADQSEHSRAKRVIVHIGDSTPHDPEPGSGLTTDGVLDLLSEVGSMSVYTVNVGSGGTPQALADLAGRTGGRTYAASTPQDLAGVLEQVIADAVDAPHVWAGGPYAATWGGQVILDGSESWDADGAIASYEWDVDGDGVYDISTTEPTKQYVNSGGDYDGRAFLRVTDADGNKNVGAARLYVSEDGGVAPDPGFEQFFTRVKSCLTGCLRASSWGDPHLVTFDGLGYDLQTAGEHVLVASDDGSVMVQTRHEQWGSSANVSVVTSVAARLTDFPVEIRASGELFIDGRAVEMEDGTWIPLIDQAAVFRNGDTYSLAWPGEDENDRFRLDVTFNGDHLNLTPFLPPSLAGLVTGLLGDGDGDPANDITTRDDQVLVQPVSSSSLYGVFGDGWRISDEESLFEYASGESTETFTDLSFPSSVVTLADLDPQDRAAARAQCLASGVTNLALVDACTMDVALTGSSQMISGALGSTEPISAVLGMYSEDFEAGAPSGWSSPTVVSAESGGEKFLGLFSSVNNRLTLSALPPHTKVTVSYDLYVLGGWGGDGGSDRFTTKVVGGATLLDKTFSNTTAGTQNFPAAGSPAKTGAVAVDTLGSYGGSGSATYHFEHTFDHWQPGLQFDFTGLGLSAGSGQYWGVDNVDVQLERLFPDLSDYQIGDTAAGSIEHPGGEDLHSFSVPAGGLDLFVDFVTCGFYNPHFQILNSSGTPVSFGGLTTLGCNDRFGTLPAGDYTLRVFQPDGSYGNYSFKMWTVPDAQSFTHTIGDTVSDQVPAAGAGRLESPGAEDLHSFSVPAGGLDLFVDFVTCGFYNPHFQILNSSGTPVSFGGLTTLGCNDRFGTLPAGDYTLRVFQPDGSYGTYSFKMWTVPDAQSFTHTIGDTVSDQVPAAGAGRLESPGAEDHFDFTVPAGGLDLFLDMVSCAFYNPHFQILNSSGTPVSFGGVTTLGCNDRFGTLPAGDYTLRVFQPEGTYGTYSVKLWTVPDPESFSYSIGDNVSNGVPVAGAGNVESPGAADVYQFTVPAGGMDLFVDLVQCFGGIFTQVLNASGTPVNTNGCNDRFITLAQGDYTFKVYSDWGNYGAYSFKLWEVPDPQSFPYTIGDTVSNGVPAAGAGNTESPGAADVYQFTVPAGGTTVFLDLTQCFGGIFTQVLNSAGSPINTNGCNDRSITLAQGDYTFKVYSDWGNYGAYGFKMTGS